MDFIFYYLSPLLSLFPKPLPTFISSLPPSLSRLTTVALLVGEMVMGEAKSEG
jgi:hypothetical protein